MTPRDKLAAARLMAIKRMPYFRSAVTGLVPKQAPGLGTFGVTKRGVLMWDPAAIERWSVEEAAGVVLHEISHLLRHHPDRQERMHAEQDLYNIAGDLEINDDLIAGGVKLPGEGVSPEKFRKDPTTKKLGLDFSDGRTAEEYYRELEKVPRQQVAQACGGEGDGESEDDGGSGRGKLGEGVGRGKCGGCAGNPNPGEDEQDADGGGRSDVEMERIRRSVAEAIVSEAGKGRGTVPGGWQRWAEAQLKPPQIPWRQKLSRAVRGAIAYRPGAVDLHYTRPSRRQAGVGFGPGCPVLPALRAPVPRVAVIVDTSGSMGQEELLDAVSECRGVLNATGAHVTFCACDAAVHELQEVRHWKDVTKLLTGGGGTDFRPAIQAMEQQRPQPGVVIFITDGMGPAPEHPPPFKVIWVLVGPYRQVPAEWGEIIQLPREGEEAAA